MSVSSLGNGTHALSGNISRQIPSGPESGYRAAHALGRIVSTATLWIERLLAQQDPPLTVTQYLTLRAIVRERISATELARRAGVSGPAVSQLLAGLADAGLIERDVVEKTAAAWP